MGLRHLNSPGDLAAWIRRPESGPDATFGGENQGDWAELQRAHWSSLGGTRSSALHGGQRWFSDKHRRGKGGKGIGMGWLGLMAAVQGLIGVEGGCANRSGEATASAHPRSCFLDREDEDSRQGSDGLDCT
jgi:hypothetical protein